MIISFLNMPLKKVVIYLKSGNSSRLTWSEIQAQIVTIQISLTREERGSACCPDTGHIIFSVYLCVCGPAAAVNASLRGASEIPALERDRQHRAHRRPEPDSHGPQRSEWPVRQVQTGTPEVPEQGTQTLTSDQSGETLMFGDFFKLKACFQQSVCVCVCRLCQRPWVHSGGSSLTSICTRRPEECWRSQCGTETPGGETTSSDGWLLFSVFTCICFICFMRAVNLYVWKVIQELLHVKENVNIKCVRNSVTQEVE